MNQQDKDRLRELATAAKNSSAERLRAFREDCMPEAILSLLEENEALARDAARLDFIESNRASVSPEFEGEWDAQFFDDGWEPSRSFSGTTVRQAIDAAMQPKGD